jgi:hypothetical protein
MDGVRLTDNAIAPVAMVDISANTTVITATTVEPVLATTIAHVQLGTQDPPVMKLSAPHLVRTVVPAPMANAIVHQATMEDTANLPMVVRLGSLQLQ